MDIYLLTQNKMCRRAMGFGITSLAFSFMYMPFISVPLAFFAILFAALSRGYSLKYDKAAKIGYITAVIGIVVALATSYKAYSAFVNDDEYRTQILETMEMVYGDSYEELYGENLTESINNWLEERSK